MVLYLSNEGMREQVAHVCPWCRREMRLWKARKARILLFDLSRRTRESAAGQWNLLSDTRMFLMKFMSSK